MIFGQSNFFNYGAVRRYTVAFGSIFSDLYIKRAADKKETFILVPLKYGKGFVFEKFGDTDESKTRTRIVLPCMSFVLDDMQYDPERKTNTFNRLAGAPFSDNSKANTQLNRVPYNFTFELAIRTKNLDDMNQIIEQIIPAFDPALTLRLKDSSELGIDQDITIKMLPGIEMEDNEEEQVENTRVLTYTLRFELKGYLYRRTRTMPMILEVVLNNVNDDGSKTEIYKWLASDEQQQVTLNQQVSLTEQGLFNSMPPA